MIYLPNVIRFLEAVGFRFHLDWDDSLEIVPPAILTADTIVDELEQYEEEIVRSLKFRAEDARRRLMGGPFDGNEYPMHIFRHGRSPVYYGRRVSRACWAVYRVQRDGRAIFAGFATSEAKAKRGELKTTQTGPGG